MDVEAEKMITKNKKHRVSSELASLDTGMHVDGLSSVSASEEEEEDDTILTLPLEEPKSAKKKKKASPSKEKRRSTPSKLATPKKKSKKTIKEDASDSEEEEVPTPSKKRATPQSKKRKADQVSTPVKSKSPASASKKTPNLDSVERVVERLGMLHIKVDEKQLAMLKQTMPHLYQELVEIMNVTTVRGVIFSFMCTTPISRIFTFSDTDKAFHSIYHGKHDLITLVDYDVEKSLDVAKTVSELSAEDRAEALAILREGEENFNEEHVQTEQWLYALIHLNIIEISPTKPAHDDHAENCLLHYPSFKKTYWLSSTTGRARLGRAVTTRYREVENLDKNRVACEALLAKRAELIAFAERYIKPLSPGSATPKRSAVTPKKKKVAAAVEEEIVVITPPKKKKSAQQPKKKIVVAVEEEEDDEEEEEEPVPVQPKKKKRTSTDGSAQKRKLSPSFKEVVMEEEKKKKTTTTKKPAKTLEQKIKENVSVVLTQKLPQKEKVASSSSFSSDGEFSFSDEEEVEEEKGHEMSADTLNAVAQIMKKQKLGLSKPNLDPNATTLLKTLEVKKNIEDAVKANKVLHDHRDPHIDWFRKNAF